MNRVNRTTPLPFAPFGVKSAGWFGVNTLNTRSTLDEHTLTIECSSSVHRVLILFAPKLAPHSVSSWREKWT